jgi:uncharacterized protein (TIGR00730 family)
MIRALAVFTGSRKGLDPALAEAAYDVGRGLAERRIDLVYGGGGHGLMGAVSQGAIDAGGRVTGVIPRFMAAREWARSTDQRVVVHHVETMHERKALMAQRADAFLVLPGGLGTLEELFEVWTWRTLGVHHKPLGLYDVGGFWQPLLGVLAKLAETGLMDRQTLKDLVVADTLDAALAGLDAAQR